MLFKKIKTAENNNTKEVDAVKTWRVEWKSQRDRYNWEGTERCEVFTDETIAKEFAQSLRNAFILLRIGTNTTVTCKENN